MPAESVVVWRNSHVSKVPRAELWGTTILMDPALGGTELDQLLGLLLRMLSPGAVPAGSQAAGNDHAGPAPGGTGMGGSPAVTASEARALTELLAAHGIAQGQLGALLGLEKSTVSRLAAGLESKGWIS